MKLKSINVGPYRNVLDSGDVAIEANVTVLVGKNESGKTNLLHAIHSLNPANGDRTIRRHDYPRWRQQRDRRSNKYQKAKPIQAVFCLTEKDKKQVTDTFGEGVLKDDKFCAYRQYEEDKFNYKEPNCDEQKAVEHLISGLQVTERPCISQLRESLAHDIKDRDDEGNTTELATDSKHVLDKLKQVYNDAESASQAVGSFLCDLMPAFFYFDDYSQLPGSTDIMPLIKAIKNEQASDLDDNQRTALALLRMGYADEELIDDDYEIRQAELQAVGAELTQNVLEYWRQNEHLRLSININNVVEDQPHHQPIARRELKLDVMDDRHYFTNSLDARSSGFRWFISFVAAFTEFENDDDVIVLLDEPGLGLHARAQADFLRFIDERLAKHHQVLFTTHSPFMIDASRLSRVRVVEDSGPDSGVKVTSTDTASKNPNPLTASKDPDTLFPLQAALGYDIAQNLFVGPDNLIVEGISDFTYLSVMSNHLKSLDRIGLDERWRILPVGGASKIPTFVALVGPSLDVTVLVDGDMIANQRIRDLMDNKLLNQKRLISPAAVSTIQDADMEDLFKIEDYLYLYNSAFNTDMRISDLSGSDRVVKRLKRSIQQDFDHNAPARYLLNEQEAILPKLSSDTLDCFEELFKAINLTLK